jgi:Uma2 family endonuclease
VRPNVSIGKRKLAMGELAEKRATYEDIRNVAEDMTGEIIDGQLLVTPKPAPKHTHVTTVLGAELEPPYRRGRGGPGGWIFLAETEVLLGEDLIVPDLAGWRKERFPSRIENNWVPVTPDWVCEIMSPSTVRTDKVRKMPLYARYGLGHIWLIDPAAMTLDVFRLGLQAQWNLLASFAENDQVRAEPFEEVEINLADLWL